MHYGWSKCGTVVVTSCYHVQYSTSQLAAGDPHLRPSFNRVPNNQQQRPKVKMVHVLLVSYWFSLKPVLAQITTVYCSRLSIQPLLSHKPPLVWFSTWSVSGQTDCTTRTNVLLAVKNNSLFIILGHRGDRVAWVCLTRTILVFSHSSCVCCSV